MKIGILGAGTWGVALARMLARNNHEITVWSAIPREVKILSETHTHPNLPEVVLPDEIVYTVDIGNACKNKDIILFAVPSVFVRSTAASARRYIPEGQIIVDVAKGIEPGSLMTMTEVIADELAKDGGPQNTYLVALSGPTHAEEVAMDMPSSIVSACADEKIAEFVQDVFMNTCMRIYTNTDVRGVELCGALKNIVALATGILAGLGYGDNTRAALITRGMAEIMRLGIAMGCNAVTFAGLAGFGDMIVTATSEHSRNNRTGVLIGQGTPPEEAIAQIGMVVEGVNAIPAALGLAKKYGVEMPIVESVDAVVNHGLNPEEGVYALMTREKKAETDDGEASADVRHPSATAPKRKMIYGSFDEISYRDIKLIQSVGKSCDSLIIAVRETDSGVSIEEKKHLLVALSAVDYVISANNHEALLAGIRKHRVGTVLVDRDESDLSQLLSEEGIKVRYTDTV